MIEWSRLRLAEAANVAERTLIDFERGARKPYDRTLADIETAQTNARQRRGEILTLQSRIGEQIARVGEARAQLETALEELRGRLFERDRPEFWSSAFRAQMRADFERGIAENLAEDLEDLRSFVLRRERKKPA